uniref:CD72 molecule n=1 Tax=Phocoena sinus TaxID=42100 RepID=A0A8C9CU61_PHOSS
MAEAITYADLRFVKAPLKKSISSRLGQDPEADEDGELTYENVQVPPGPGGPSSLASAGLGDKAGVQSEQPTAAWSRVTSPAAGRILACKWASAGWSRSQVLAPVPAGGGAGPRGVQVWPTD